MPDLSYLYTFFFAEGDRKENRNIYLSWKVFCATSIPVILNELLWALGEAAVSMILGRIGMEVVSVNAIYANISETQRAA